jgi:hypothetical protein
MKIIWVYLNRFQKADVDVIGKGVFVYPEA